MVGGSGMSDESGEVKMGWIVVSVQASTVHYNAWGIKYGVPNGTAVVSFVVVDVYVMHALFRSSRRGSCIMG